MGRGLQSQAHVDSNSSLILRPLTKEAHGRWECTASNAVAQVATSTNVYVLGLWLQSWGLQETVWDRRWGIIFGGPDGDGGWGTPGLPLALYLPSGS